MPRKLYSVQDKGILGSATLNIEVLSESVLKPKTLGKGPQMILRILAFTLFVSSGPAAMLSGQSLQIHVSQQGDDRDDGRWTAPWQLSRRPSDAYGN